MTKITILGSCRQDSLYNKYDITSIKNGLSYPHYSKEVLQVIKYCINDNLKPDETMIFRTPILRNSPYKTNIFLHEIEKSDVIIIEIASKKYYKYNNLYVHHILYDDNKYNTNYKTKIETGVLTHDEIIQDLHEISILLKNKKVIFVGHLVTKEFGDRYDLLCLIKSYCKENNLLFIDPISELKLTNNNIHELIDNTDKCFAHYTEKGHNEILKIYDKYIKQILYL